MAGVSPIFGLPYPTATAAFPMGDNAVRALAERLDGTAWVAPVLGAGWATGTGTGTILVYRKDGVGNVHIQGWLGFPGAQPVGVPAFVLPTSFRPPRIISGAVQDLAQAAHAFGGWSVLTSGDVNVGSGLPAGVAISTMR